MNEAHREREEIRELREEIKLDREIVEELRDIRRDLEHPTPTGFVSKEITMLAIAAGNTPVFTITYSPAGSVFPAGTTFTASANDPAITPTISADGTIVTVPLPTDWVQDGVHPLAVSLASSTFVPNPSTSPAQIAGQVFGPAAGAAVTPVSFTAEQTT
jgi:hypothetical protein